MRGCAPAGFAEKAPNLATRDLASITAGELASFVRGMIANGGQPDGQHNDMERRRY
jgi:hypothetical protein